MNGSLLQSSELSDGPGTVIETAPLLRANAAVDARYTLSPSWEALLQLPVASLTRFDEHNAAAISHLVLGARLYLATSETEGFAMILHTALTTQLPVMAERRVGDVYTNDQGLRSDAPIADGFFGAEPQIGMTILIEDVELEVGTGFLIRTQAVNRIRSRIALRVPIVDRLHLDTIVHSDLAQDPRPTPPDGRPPILSTTGIGEFTEQVTMTLQLGFQLTPHYEWGGGVIIPLQQVEYAHAPSAVVLFRYTGHHPSAASKMIEH